jgi:Flp pilus assembly protein TadD
MSRRESPVDSAHMHDAAAAWEARFRAACEAHQRGDWALAEHGYQALLQERPGDGECLHLLGLLAFATGRGAWAEQLLEQAVARDPDNPRWLTARAHVLAAQGRMADALAALTQVVRLEPGNAAAWVSCGTYLQKSGDAAAAIAAYLQALALDPANPQAHNHLGAVLRQEDDLDGAAAHFAAAVELDPHYADAYSNWGVALHARCDFAGAVRKFAEALRLEPEHGEANGQMGGVLSLLGHPDAEQRLRRSLAAKPDDPEARLNLGLHLLRQGAFAEGWRLYEARWTCPGFGRSLPPMSPPRWTGPPSAPGQSLRGTTLLVYAEQGFGDTFQFVRYIPRLLEQGARVVLEVHSLLAGLLRAWAARFGGELQVLAEGESQPEFDWHVPLLSLPLAFATDRDSIPPPIRLTPPAHKTSSSGLRIGLSWAGNPRHALDRDRSVPLALLAPLFSVPGVTFVSLQRGAAARQIEAAGLPVETPELAGFETTAAVLDTLDLVISVDTAAAHLAATQGVPTWILLPFVMDWRWHLPAPAGGPDTSAWYPGVRLWRQAGLAPPDAAAGAAWQPVILRMRAALEAASRAAAGAELEATS